MLLECNRWYALALPIEPLVLNTGAHLLGVGGSKHLVLWHDDTLWDMTDCGVDWERYPMSWVNRSEVLGTVDVVELPLAYMGYDRYAVTTMGLLQAAKREGSWFPIHGWSYRYCCYDILTLVTGGKLLPHRTWQSTVNLTCTPL